MLTALELGRLSGTPRVAISPALHDTIVADPLGDRLDALLCLVQAAWAANPPAWP